MTTNEHWVHDDLPNGFSFADRLQVDAFMATGSVPGASKVCLVAAEGGPPGLATRLRPPRDWTPDQVLDYKDGWADGKALAIALTDPPDSPYIAGYRDAAENRMKWHLAHCPDHGDHESGCHA